MSLLSCHLLHGGLHRTLARDFERSPHEDGYHAAPIPRRRSEVVDRGSFPRRDARGLGDGGTADRALAEIAFRFGGADDRRRNGTKGNARRAEMPRITVREEAGSDIHERQCLSFTQAKLQKRHWLTETRARHFHA